MVARSETIGKGPGELVNTAISFLQVAAVGSMIGI